MVTVERITQAESIEEFRALQQQIMADSATGGDAELQPLYDESREWIRQRRVKFPDLPRPHPYRGGDPKVGTDDHVEWCDEAKPVTEKISLSFDVALINNFIQTLTALLQVRERFAGPPEKIFRNALEELGAQPEHAEAVAILQDCLSDRTEAVLEVVTLSRAIPLTAAQKCSLFLFLKAVERHCRKLDPAYADTIEQTTQQSITIARQLDQLWCGTAGSMVAAHDALTGSKIKKLVTRAWFYSFDTFIDALVFGTAEAHYFEPLREAIRIFKGFRERIRTTHARVEPKAADGADDRKKHRREKRTKAAGPDTGKAWTPWKDVPRRTCFVIINDRFKLWHKGEQKDLRLQSKRRPCSLKTASRVRSAPPMSHRTTPCAT
jgi:hypothetical protein